MSTLKPGSAAALIMMIVIAIFGSICATDNSGSIVHPVMTVVMIFFGMLAGVVLINESGV